MKRAMTVLLLGLSFCTGPMASVRAATPDLVGSWVFDASQSDDVEAAVKTAVEKVNFIIRGFAHGRLRNTNKPYRTLAILVQGKEVQIKKDARVPVKAPLDGTPVKWRREDGQTYDLSLHLRSDVYLEESIGNAEGKRVNTYKLRPTGSVLDMSVTVSSGKLPVPLTYRLAYRRVP